MSKAIQTDTGLQMSLGAAAAYIGQQVGTMASWRQRGQGPAFLIIRVPGARRAVIRYRQADLDQFIAAEERRAGRLPRPHSGYAPGTRRWVNGKLTLTDPAKNDC
jgi:hypothetical protein